MSILLRLSFIYRILFDLESFVYSSLSFVQMQTVQMRAMKSESIWRFTMFVCTCQR